MHAHEHNHRVSCAAPPPPPPFPNGPTTCAEQDVYTQTRTDLADVGLTECLAVGEHALFSQNLTFHCAQYYKLKPNGGIIVCELGDGGGQS